MTTTKVLVTSQTALKAKYGAGWTKIRGALNRLIAADAARGIATTLVDLDQQNPAPALRKPATFKAAIDRAYLSQNRPDYMLILGGADIVPHQPLINPVFQPRDDDDEHVPSDLPYACDAPFSTAIEDFIAPSRVVGRLPDLPGTDDPALLVTLLDHASRARSFASAGSRFFGLTAEVWKRSTQHSLHALFGSSVGLHVSPDDGPDWSSSELSPEWHFINCHGAPSDSKFYGQRRKAYPVAHQAARLAGKITSGAVVAAECCYGAQLYHPRGRQQGICVTYLREGAMGFVGSTTIAYGPATTNNHADLICRYFLDGTRKQASLGRALLEARQQYIKESAPLSPIALKTIAQFLLLGDPSLHAVAGARTGHRSTKARPAPRAAAASVATSHAATRGALAYTADLLTRGVDTARSVAQRTPPGIRRRLEREASKAGAVPVGTTRTFGVDAAPDPVARALVTRAKAVRVPAPTVRFHVMFATAPAQARGTSRRNAPKAITARRVAEDKVPRGVSTHMVLLAHEQGGRVTVERLYARLSPRGSDMADQLEGHVIRRLVGAGTKSARSAVLLQTPSDELVLRREDGNAFQDDVLDGLVGHDIRGTGHRTGYTFVLEGWEDLGRTRSPRGRQTSRARRK